MKQWLQRMWTNSLKSLESLLHQSTEGCVFCGNRIVRSNKFPQQPLRSLCLRCAEQLQWIDTIECSTCGRGEPCGDCRRRSETAFVASRSAVRYSESVKGWLARFKYRGDERLKHLFADMLELTMKRHFHDHHGGICGRIDVLTYVPISQERFEERGFNQAQLLAEELGKRLKIPVQPMLLRSRHTGKQSYKGRLERLEAMKQAFVIHPDAQKRILTKLDFRPINIVIIDDVYTTGSTMNQCAYVIASHLPAKVYGLTWAR